MPESVKIREAAVIGGGPAGAAAAILLAGAGREVILFEKERFAHDKVCGGFISWEAADYLRRLGIDLPGLGAQAVRRLRLIDGGRVLEAPLPFPAWSLSRRVLDEALLEKAERAGAKIMRGCNITGLAQQENSWVLKTAVQETAQAKTVFLASGKHELRGWPRLKRRKKDFIGFKMHFRLSPVQCAALRGGVEIVLLSGGYAGLELVENDSANLCFLVEKDIYTACGKTWDDLLIWLIGEAPHLMARLDGATPLWPRPSTVYNIPYGYIYKSDMGSPGLIRLGDQMAVIPSFAGDGIAIALHSGFAAGSAYLSGDKAEDCHRLMRDAFRGPVRNARLLSSLMSSGPGRRGAFLLLRLVPGLMPQAIHGTRLPHRTMLLSKQCRN
jgi:menaquinone-9 beta-reductase